MNITTYLLLCNVLVLTHLPWTNGDFKSRHRPSQGSHGPLRTTDNSLDHVILHPMAYIAYNYNYLSSTLCYISLNSPSLEKLLLQEAVSA